MIDDKSEQVARLLYVLDVLIALLAFVLAYDLRIFQGKEVFVPIPAYVLLVFLLVLLFGWALSFAGAYSRLRTQVLTHAITVLSGLAFSVGAFLTVIFFVLHDESVSRSLVGHYAIITFFLTVSVRAILVWWYFKRKEGGESQADRILIVGTGSRASTISEALESYSEWGVEIIGFLEPMPDKASCVIEEARVLGTIDEIQRVLKHNVVDEVVIAVPRTMINTIGKVYAACEEEGVKLLLMSDIFDFQVARMRLKMLGGIPLLSFEPVAFNAIALSIKRIFDLTAVLLALPVLVPLFLVIALAIKLDSPGPVFFVQHRVGLRKRTFPMYKFRSMVVNAEEKLKDIEHLNEADGPIFKIADDPRITRIGKIVRKTSIDELPQLINVLVGHMTLVGPRPMSTRDVNLFDKGIQRRRFSVRPGLTGLWQISGRSNLPFEKWLEYDLTYIDNWSLKLDLEILLKTVPVILKGEGAV